MEIPRLHPDTIEQVKQRADIVDVVSEHVVLRKQGKDFSGLCPFHDDKSPSFTVSPSKQFYYCFSCGAGGNAIKFMMELSKRPFSEVVLDLARRYQVSVQTLKVEERQEFQRQLSVREQL
ncbi:MAG TPA: CHC2 zinc finger domain-containing protein, partial [Thermosynechococcaceae cyanobacterium]